MLFGSRSPRSDILLSVDTVMSELFLMTTDHSNIKVSADNNMSDHRDLDPNNIPSVGFDPPLL